MDERDAVSLLRAGDIGGLEPLVRNYQVRALKAAFLITQERSLAEDVAAAAFLKAYDRIHQFDTQRVFGPWFLRIGINDARKAEASRRREVSLDQSAGSGEQGLADTLADPGPGLEKIAVESEARYVIGSAIAKLSPRQREAMALRYYLGVGEAEIATRQGNTVATVRRHLYDARTRLRSMLRVRLKGGEAEE